MARERSDLIFHIVAFIIAAIVIVISLLAIYRGGMVIETGRVDVKFEIGSSVGIDLNSSSLSYGRMLAGSTQTRKLNITNTYPFDVSVKFVASKNIENVISFTQPVERLAQGQSIVTEFTLRPAKDMPIGNYSGQITVEIMK